MFFLFTYESYYPNGGLFDYKAAFPTLDAAKAAAAGYEDQNVQIATISDGQLVMVAHAVGAYAANDEFALDWTRIPVKNFD